jgi:thymidylate synthase
MVSAWNVGELDQMVLPPCHYGFQVWTREEDGKRYISLMWNQRSVDTFLGLPFNIASYGLLLHIIANEVNMVPDELIGNLGDTHLYLNHIEQAKEQIGRTSFDLPTLKTNVKIDGICCNVPDDFILEGYQYHPTIKAPLSN